MSRTQRTRHALEIDTHYWAMFGADWVWQWACSLHDAGIPPSPTNATSSVLEAVKILRLRASGVLLPDTARAIEIYERDQLDRAILEARILTGIDTDRIASTCGISPTVVTTFEALFFQVRPFANATSWVLNHAVCRNRVDTTGDIGVVLRRAGYLHGPLILELMIELVNRTCDWIYDPLPDLATEEGRRTLWTRLVIVAEMFALSKSVDATLLRWRQLLTHAEHREQSQQALDRVLDELEASTGPVAMDTNWAAIHEAASSTTEALSAVA